MTTTQPKQPKKKQAKIGASFRLTQRCLTRLARASKRSGKSQARILEDAVLAHVAMYLNPVKRAA